MLFRIERNALDYIKKKGIDITVWLETFHSGGGWCAARQVTTRTPAVRRGKPGLKEKYATVTVDGITIWYARDINIDRGGCTIALEKRWIFKELVIKGVASEVLHG